MYSNDQPHPGATDSYIPLENVQNLRDLGGLKTPDNAGIKPGRLLRSGNPGQATAADIARLQGMNIDVVVDFRADDEKTPHEADFAAAFLWQAEPIVAGNLSGPQMLPTLQRMSQADMHELMCDLYRDFPGRYQPQFHALLQLAEQGKTMLYHCTAGKDRTGFASALLLSALGVDADSIMVNYLESNHYNQRFIQDMADYLERRGVKREAVWPLLEVSEEYLDTALRVIDRDYGGMANYLRKTLNVDIERIRQHYLA